MSCGASGIEAGFEEIATRAGVALGDANSADQFSRWLLHTWFFLRSGKYKQKHTCRYENGACIFQPMEASRAHCLALAKEAFKRQREGERSHSSPAATDEPVEPVSNERLRVAAGVRDEDLRERDSAEDPPYSDRHASQSHQQEVTNREPTMAPRGEELRPAKQALYDQALALLSCAPDIESVQAQVVEGVAGLVSTNQKLRLAGRSSSEVTYEVGIQWFDIHAEAYLRTVSDRTTRDAFTVVLEMLKEVQLEQVEKKVSAAEARRH